MNKEQFLVLLGQAYGFPDYYGHNLDSADEILSDLAENSEAPLSLRPLFDALLAGASAEERQGVWELLADHFGLEGGG